MTETKTIDLIRGTFSPNEASDILMEIIRSKINIHNIRNWSSEERFGKPDSYSTKRLGELRATEQYLKDYFKEARLLNKNIRITCEIDLELE